MMFWLKKRKDSFPASLRDIGIGGLIYEILTELLFLLRSRREKKTFLLPDNQVPTGRRMISRGLDPRDFQTKDIYLDPSQSSYSGKIGEPRFK